MPADESTYNSDQTNIRQIIFGKRYATVYDNPRDQDWAPGQPSGVIIADRSWAASGRARPGSENWVLQSPDRFAAVTARS
jgi:hypothetical protein